MGFGGRRRGRRRKGARRGGRGLLCCFGERTASTIQPMTAEEAAFATQVNLQYQQGTLDENSKAQLMILQQLMLQKNQQIMQNGGRMKPEEFKEIFDQQRNAMNQIKQNQAMGTTQSSAFGPMQPMPSSAFASEAVYPPPFAGEGASSSTFASGTVYSQPFSQQYYSMDGTTK